MNNLIWEDFGKKLNEPSVLGFKSEWSDLKKLKDEKFVDFALWYMNDFGSNNDFSFYSKNLKTDFSGFVKIPDGMLFGSEHTSFDYLYIKSGEIKYLQRRKLSRDYIMNDSIFFDKGFSINREYSQKIDNESALAHMNRILPVNEHSEEISLSKVFRLGSFNWGDLKLKYQELCLNEANVFIQGKGDFCAFLKFNLESELKYSEFVSIANENILSFQNKEEFLKLFGDEKITNLRLGYSTFSSDLTLRKALDMKE
ncbi:hypothetical protein GW932_04630 [archaeon]|nr:hypothetical protein [archaeon]